MSPVWKRLVFGSAVKVRIRFRVRQIAVRIRVRVSLQEMNTSLYNLPKSDLNVPVCVFYMCS